MKIFEFVEDDPYRVRLTAVVNQFKSRLKQHGSKKNPRTDAFLNFLRDNDVIIDKNQLFDLIKQEPLKNLIKNVNQHEVEFFDADKDIVNDVDDDQNEKVVKNLAKKALK